MAAGGTPKGLILPELADEVLRHHTDLYAQDPAMQWTYCRHISQREKRRIEKRFEEFWLKKLIVTINHGPWDQLDYQQLRPRPKANSPEAYEPNEIRFDINSDVRGATDLVQLWKDALENPGIVTLRLGENYLNGGLQSAYIVNDSGLPGLTVSENGRFITFDWIKTFDHLLREEIMLRKTRARMFEEALQKQAAARPDGHYEPTRHDLIKILHIEVKMASRVEVYKHRLRRQDPSGQSAPRFQEHSKHFHRQAPTHLRQEAERGGCSCCSRRAAPDLFEILSQEESVVPMLPGWEQLTWDEMGDAYGEEFGWACLTYRGRELDAEADGFRLQRKSDWMRNTKDWESRLVSGQLKRWDTLG